MHSDQFVHYNSPECARKVWEEYRLDLSTSGTMKQGLAILAETRDVDSLDIRLNQLLENATAQRRIAHIDDRVHQPVSANPEDTVLGISEYAATRSSQE